MKKKVISIFAVLALLLAFAPSMVFASITDLEKTADVYEVETGSTIEYTITFNANEGVRWAMEDVFYLGAANIELVEGSVRVNGVVIEAMSAAELALLNAARASGITALAYNSNLIVNRFTELNVLTVDMFESMSATDILAWAYAYTTAVHSLEVEILFNDAELAAIETILASFVTKSVLIEYFDFEVEDWLLDITPSALIFYVEDYLNNDDIEAALDFLISEGVTTEADFFAEFMPLVPQTLAWIDLYLPSHATEVAEILATYEAAAMIEVLDLFLIFESFIFTEEFFYGEFELTFSDELAAFLAIDFSQPAFSFDGSTLWVVGDLQGEITITFEVIVTSETNVIISNSVTVNEKYYTDSVLVEIYVVGNNNQNNNQVVVRPPVYDPAPQTPVPTPAPYVPTSPVTATPLLPLVQRGTAHVGVEYESADTTETVLDQPDTYVITVPPTQDSNVTVTTGVNVTTPGVETTTSVTPVVAVTTPAQTPAPAAATPVTARVNPQTGDIQTPTSIFLIIAMMAAFAGLLVSAVLLFAVSKKRKSYR